MKNLKKFLPVAIVLIAFVGFGFYKLDLYTTEKTNTFAELVASTTISEWDGEIRTLSLGDVMIENVHANTNYIPEDYWSGEMAGSNTPTSYKEGWRKLAVNNPNLLLKSLSTYGPTFVSAYEKACIERVAVMRSDTANWKVSGSKHRNFAYVLKDWQENKWHYSGIQGSEKWNVDSVRAYVQRNHVEWVKDSLAVEANLHTFSMKTIWANHKATLGNYEKLTVELLKLSDKQLNTYVKLVAEDGSYHPEKLGDFFAWMERKKLAPPQNNYSWEYPYDLLSFVHRISRDYPSWKQRDLLLYVQKGLKAVKAQIPT